MIVAQALGFGIVGMLVGVFAVRFSAHSVPRPRGLPPAHSWISLASALAGLPITFLLPLLPADAPLVILLILLLQVLSLSPALLMVAPLLGGVFAPTNSGKGTEVAQLGYSLLAGVSFATYITTLISLAFDKSLIPLEPTSLADLWAAATTAILSLDLTPCALALVIDFAGIFLGVGLIVLREEGFGALLIFLASGALFSPGFACATAFHRRETRLF